jgi:hypothetical protein
MSELFSAFLYSPPSAPSRGIYHSLEAVRQQANREIDHAYALAGNTKIGKQLGIRDRGESFDSLDFKHGPIFHNQVESIGAVELHVFVDHRAAVSATQPCIPLSPLIG